MKATKTWATYHDVRGEPFYLACGTITGIRTIEQKGEPLSSIIASGQQMVVRETPLAVMRLDSGGGDEEHELCQFWLEEDGSPKTSDLWEQDLTPAEK